MLKTLLVEDNNALRRAMKTGLEATGKVQVIGEAASGEDALPLCLDAPPDAILMDVHLAGEMNGIQAAVAIRRELPRLPVVFYSIQDDDTYYRDFLRSGILSHYAYVRKSNYLLPASIVPLLQDAAAGRSFIDPEIEARVQEVRHKDEYDPLALLEPNEREVIALVAQGLTNEQIAERLGFRDKRAVSRTNGQIYAAWRLNETPTDEKVA
ncbi:MAG: response regulator, partial [Anaerolineae bacterium]